MAPRITTAHAAPQVQPMAQPAWDYIKTALDQIDDGLTVFDANLTLVAWNERFFDLIDCPREPFARVGTPFADLIRFNAERGEYGEGDIEDLIAERVERARNFRAHEFERLRPNGRILQVTGHPLPGGGFVTIYKDVTESRQADAALQRYRDELEDRVERRTAELRDLNEKLQQSEGWIRLIADTAPAVIGYVDSNQRYRFANRPYESWFGRAPNDILGRTPREVLGPILGESVFETHQAHIRDALAGKPGTWEFDFDAADGQHRQVMATFVPHWGPDGAGKQRVLGYVIMGQDITDRRQTEAALAQAQKMQAIGQLTGGLAHDFNNLLTIIIGNLACLEETAADDDRELLEPSLGAARRGAALVKRLLAFARRQSLQPEQVDPAALVFSMTDLLRRAVGAGLEMELTIKGRIWPVMADPHQLENALLNLALNARDAVQEAGRDGSLLVACENIHLTASDAMRQSEAEAGDYVAISLTDNGGGMGADVRQRALEPFFTTKAAHAETGSGSGLGLSMVYGFVRQSGGFMAIDSRLGEGTTVRLYLPRSVDGPEEGRPLARDAASPPRWAEGRRMVLCEDDADVRKVAARQARDLGFDVIETESAAQVLSHLEELSGIDVLLTDIELGGGMNGIALAESVRENWPDVALLLMTGFSDRAFPAQQETASPDLGLPLLPKPFEAADLSRSLKRALFSGPA